MHKKILILVIFLASLLRFYHLGLNPPSLNWDETAHGYNAYSILKTGKDEYGNKFPLSFRSFDDYKPPVYTYLVVPSIAIFGLNDFAVRLPSALLGTLAVIFTFLMVNEIIKSKKIALLAAFFLAVSPWHLQFSRVALESNSTTFFALLGTYCFLRGVRSKRIKITFWFCLTSISFGIDLFVYHNARVFIPLFSLTLAIIFWNDLKKILKHIIIPTLLAIIFILPLAFVLTSKTGQTRFYGTSVISDKGPQYKASRLLLNDQKLGQELAGKLVHNRRLAYVPIIIENYLTHFEPSFLFLKADQNRHHAPGIGLLYIWDLPFLLAGIYFFFSKNLSIKSKLVIATWFLLAPVAASVTWGVPHAVRAQTYLPIYQIFIATGVAALLKRFKNTKVFIVISIILFALNFAFYLHQYYIHMPFEFSKDWQYGRKEAVAATEALKANYSQIIISTALEQPHEFWLYYTKYDPNIYLAQGGTVSGGFLENKNHFDKYRFESINFTNQSKQQDTLFVGLPTEFPPNAKIVQKINYLNGEPAIFIVDGR